MKREIERTAFGQVIEAIKSRFPHLRTELIDHHPPVDVLLDIPAQSGLAFEVSLNLQNCDELHLNAGSFWCEWFPCREKAVVDKFIEVVCGLLAGDHRIVEYKRNGKAFKAQLQKQENGVWKNVATWSRFHLPVSWGVGTTVLQNAK